MEIRKLDGDVLRLNTEDMASNTRFSLQKTAPHAAWDLHIDILDSGKKIMEDTFDTVWYRKPEAVRPPKSITESHAQEFAQEEFDYFLRSLYTLLSSKRWVNKFWGQKFASQKLPNLEVATNLGLRVPKTMITNSIEEAEAFAKGCDWNLLVKTFHFSGFVVNNTEPWHCFANRVSKEDFYKFSSGISVAPAFLQEYIEKSIELRVTVMGDRMFTAALHSQEIEKTQHDWRAIDSYRVPHTVYNLPKDIEDKLFAFNRYYDLEFSTFDLILTPQGEYVFLECNPNGQWYWIEDMTKLPMANTMAKMLLGCL
jgi:glutathione synthase/RimK-type ligase-like ATP-grasp enzyme